MLITLAEERMHEVGGKKQADSPGLQAPQAPSTALMRARGADGHTRGAEDYCLYPKGASERILRIRGEKGTRRDACSHSASRNLTITVMYW